jgi:D-glycero-D-manno-heptose 1,7-bisphosphate phosphatase
LPASSPPDRTAPASRRAVFLDRDGTLNVDLHYLRDPARLELHRGVGAGLRRLREAGFLLLVVTNQSGVVRGLYTAADVEALHARLLAMLKQEGASVDAFYYCPHAPEQGCACRKPGIALFQQAAREWDLELARCAILGDRYLDVQAGRRLGMFTAYVPEPGSEGDYPEERPRALAEADLVASSFLEAAEGIVQRLEGPSKVPLGKPPVAAGGAAPRGRGSGDTADMGNPSRRRTL